MILHITLPPKEPQLTFQYVSSLFSEVYTPPHKHTFIVFFILDIDIY